MEYKVFYEELRKVGGISALWGRVLDAIKEMATQTPDEALCLFAMYFSLLDAGNTAICLDANVLGEKWDGYWNGLLKAYFAGDDADVAPGDDRPDFGAVISSGAQCLLGGKASALVDVVQSGGSMPSQERLFVVEDRNGKPYLFANKYYKAVRAVGSRLKRLFPSADFSCDEAAREAVASTYKVDGRHDLNQEQVLAILRGKDQNIVLSGGPGTGKTTVVCFLLHYLLSQRPELANHAIYLAASSGKAADRLKEGIDGSIRHLADDAAKKKISEAKSCTIHKLLGYMAGANKFRMNKDNQFPAESIFVIDEASMIDVCIFQSLLEAIPDGARLFILGDPYQLPSVQAGAVLGDMLSADGVSCRVDLVRANRFGQDSAVGRFASAIKDAPSQEGWTLPDEYHFDGVFNLVESERGEYPINFISVPAKLTDKRQMLQSVVGQWYSAFYKDCKEKARSISPGTERDVLDNLWESVERAKILCATREGTFGTMSLNQAMCKMFNQARNDFFVGQQLIITRNIGDLDLYNGDCGIVVRYDHELCFMVKKASDFRFIPLYRISTDSVETAFAMTIHKSQGSGYRNILICLPEKVGHPMLNNQILYTAVTRTKGCTYVLSSRDALTSAAKTRIARDTMIEFPKKQ